MTTRILTPHQRPVPLPDLSGPAHALRLMSPPAPARDVVPIVIVQPRAPQPAAPAPDVDPAPTPPPPDQPTLAQLQARVSELEASLQSVQRLNLARHRTQEHSRPAPQIVVTSRYVHLSDGLDLTHYARIPQPWLQRLKAWLHSH